MKTKSNLIQNLTVTAAVLLAAGMTSGIAAEKMKPMKGGEHLLMLNKIETKAEADALKADDTFAMICAKCKTVFVTRVKQGAKGAEILMAGGQPKELIGLHACSGCNSTIEVTGHGKGKETVLKHICRTCGDDSAFCCATKSGETKSKGSEKK